MSIDRECLVAGGIYLGLGVTCGVISSGYPIGSLQRMGAGYFPLMMSVALGLIGAVIILKALLTRSDNTVFANWRLRPMLFVTLAVVLFGLLLKPAGLLAAMTVLIVVSAIGNPNRSWPVTAGAVAVLAPMTWLVFIALLRLPLTMLPRAMGVL